MDKIEQAQEILKMMGLPPAQQNEISALTLLALCGIGPDDQWKNASRNSLGISKGIMDFVEKTYGRKYAPNTRETFRRQVLHQFIQARVIDYNPDNPELPTNSPHAHYALTDDALKVVRAFGTKGWRRAYNRFVSEQGSLWEKYRKTKTSELVPVKLPDGTILKLSPGKHNAVQAAVIEQFMPRFAPDAKLLYLGDTAKKTFFSIEEDLVALGIRISDHDKLPDVIFYDPDRERLFLIEAVTSHGPMSPKRFIELEEMLSECKVTRIFVTAFPNFAEFRKHMEEIAWETEVWLVDAPDHMIHYNGEKFLNQ